MTDHLDSGRTYVVTGAASGIGAAVARHATAQGNRVIGVDLRDSDVCADLATPAGRAGAVAEIVRLSGGQLDAVITCAGLRHADPATVSVNYFGSVEVVTGLQQALARSSDPRVVLTSSLASVLPNDPAIVKACLSHDEDAARAAVMDSVPDESGRARVYSSSKTAVSRWVRRIAAEEGWADAGILVNAVAPGTIATPMTTDVTASEEATAQWLSFLPNAQSRIADVDEIAEVFCWLASPLNSLLVGQTVFADLGSELHLRGDETW